MTCLLPSRLVSSWRAPPRHLAVHDLGTGEAWSWGRLGEEARSLASQLRVLGVPPGGRVALCLPSGPRFIAALWATWLLDAAWCPLPPSLAPVLLKERLAHLDPHAVVTAVGVDRGTPLLPPCPRGSAYIIHTSGSTGAPKGVLVGTSGLPALWAGQASLFATRGDTRAAWMLSPAFDASVSDIGVALSCGASLFTVPAGRWQRWSMFERDVLAHGITQVDAPPSWLGLHASRIPPSTLETVVAGGEPTPPAIVKAWSGRVRWVNVYGPTEATVCVSAERRFLGAGDDGPATLGTPLPGVLWHVQDPSFPCPGQPSAGEGELWLGGDCVAMGYWRDPGLSSLRFVEHAGARWFRTGDVVRKVGGSWCFQGRLDRQVKRRGQLLHLDGVEAVLAACPGVAAAAVYLDAHSRLVAHVEHAAGLDEKSLVAWAAGRLPAWGVPQRWVRRDGWPRTPSGKIDRRSLEAEAPR